MLAGSGFAKHPAPFEFPPVLFVQNTFANLNTACRSRPRPQKVAWIRHRVEAVPAAGRSYPREFMVLPTHLIVGEYMNYDEFTGQIQHRLELPGTGETVRAIRATLSTLGQRIPEGSADDLAASLPMEIDWYLTGAVGEHGERFDWREFVSRVSEIEGVDPPEAAYHANVVMDLVSTVVPESDLQQLRDQLPESDDDEDWGELFELIDSGGWSEAREAQTGGGPQSGAGGGESGGS